MNARKIISTGQEQAVAAWIGYLNQVRFTDLMNSLNQQDLNLQAALDELKETTNIINMKIIDSGRGGDRGVHGFIAEIAEVGIGNAHRILHGENKGYVWIDNNGVNDIQIDDVFYQMKFARSGDCFSLNAVSKHLEQYPDYLKSGHKYIIPKDFYDNVKTLAEMDSAEAAKLSNAQTELSYRQWRRVQDFFKDNNMTIDDLEPSQLDYEDVQKDRIQETLKKEKETLKEEDRKVRNKAYGQSKPSLEQAAQATLSSAVIEGGMTFALAIFEKRKNGKELKDFTQDDWQEIGEKTGISSFKGGIRGISIYTLTNFSATPCAVASALCTASFGVAEQACRFRHQEINEVELIQCAEIACLDAAVSALSSSLGQTIIPIPILGAVIGNTVGTIMYQAAKDGLSSREQELAEQYMLKQKELNQQIEEDYAMLIGELQVNMLAYVELLSRAFHPDPQEALDGSVALAKSLGISQCEILDSAEKIDSYFLD